jgi:hypothetical protein
LAGAGLAGGLASIGSAMPIETTNNKDFANEALFFIYQLLTRPTGLRKPHSVNTR